jgi:hypothetical protein
MKKKKHIDVDDMKAGDDIDWMLTKKLYDDKTRNKLWFIKGPRGKYQYFGPRYSTSLEEALSALYVYCGTHKEIVKAYYLREEMGDSNNPYACTAEILFNRPQFFAIRSWASTMPLAITRMLLKAPMHE